MPATAGRAPRGTRAPREVGHAGCRSFKHRLATLRRMSARPISTPWRTALAGALLLASLAPLGAQAQWKWREGGRVQYSDRPPPPSVAEKDIISRPAGGVRPAPVVAPAAAAEPAASAASAAVPASDPKLEARKREAEQKQAAEQKAREEKLAADRKQNCDQAQTYLRTLESGMRIARVNDRGDREFLNDEQRSAEAARARQVIASDCRK